MSHHVGSSQTLKILDVKGRNLELHEVLLARLLLADRVKDKPVVVIAVAGALRKGKSFLLCFLLRYLRSKGQAEWLGDPNAPLTGFEWRGGSDPHTSGILVWNEVFLVKTSQGEELAVLLMDTQGVFDCESASVVHASIFSLAALISSVLVYNLAQNIQQNDLEHLKDFLEYGMQTMSEPQQPSGTTAEVGCARPFQSLMFLVRDWQFEKPYGLEGGRPLLEKRLKGPQKQDKELRKLRRKLSKCFTETRCFLMPHPGLRVSQEGFDGRLSHIDETFKLHLFEFVRLLLNPDNLLPKEINGRKVTCQELFSYIKVYVKATKRGLLEDPSQMLQATHAGSCRVAMDKYVEFYTTSMIPLWDTSPGADSDTMRVFHDELSEVAHEMYWTAPKMGGVVQAQRYSKKLLKRMNAAFNVYGDCLKEKKPFINAAFQHVAFKVVHGFLTTGLVAGVVALAVVELPVVAAALGAFGAASLTGHIVQLIVEKKLAKRKRKERLEKTKAAAEAVGGASDIDECDEEAPLASHEQLPAQDDTCSVLSLELAECASTSPEAPVTVTDEVETTCWGCSSTAAGASNGSDGSEDRAALAATEAANSSAFDRAIEHYRVGMQQVCGDSVPRISEEELQKCHDLLQSSARKTLMRGCASAGTRMLPEFFHRLANGMEEEFKNFVNQNREKPTVTS